MTKETTVVIVEDDELLRSSFKALVDAQPGMKCIGTAPNGMIAQNLCSRVNPNVVIMDIQMPECDGIRATAEICRTNPATRVLILTLFDIEDNLINSLRAGASGFLSKTCRSAELIQAIEIVNSGNSLISPHLITHLVERALANGATARRHTVSSNNYLTQRETELITLVGRGLSNKEIAAELFLSPETIKTYVSRVLAKTCCRDRAQLVIFAYENGLV